MTLQTRKQIYTRQILANILKSKGNQTIKLSQKTVENKRNTFLKRSWRKCDTETSSTTLIIF